ncbi:MAG: hypothetical protein ABL953_11055 [Ilumatobacteraceae bacterium]
MHRSMVKQWCRSRKLPTTMLQLLPRHGLIVPDVAVAFLYQTDSKIAFVDGFMSNPDASMDDRLSAFDAITEGLEVLARRLGFKHIWVFTTRKGVVAQAERHGWKADDKSYLFVGKELT